MKLFEDMFSVDFSQNRTGTRFRGHYKLLYCHAQEIFFSDWYYLFKFFCRLLEVPVVPVSTSTKFVSYRSSRKTRAATVFVLSNPDLISKMILLQNLHFDGER